MRRKPEPEKPNAPVPRKPLHIGIAVGVGVYAGRFVIRAEYMDRDEILGVYKTAGSAHRDLPRVKRIHLAKAASK